MKKYGCIYLLILIGILLSFPVGTWAATDLSSIRWIVLSDAGYYYRQQDYEDMAAIGVNAILDGINWKDMETTEGYYDFSVARQSYERCTAAGLLWIPHLAVHVKPTWLGSKYDYFTQDSTNVGYLTVPNYFYSGTQTKVVNFINAFCSEFTYEADNIPLVFISVCQYGEAYYPASTGWAAFDDYTIAAWRSYTGDASAMPYSSTTDTSGSGGTVEEFQDWWYEKMYEYIAYANKAVVDNFPNTRIGLKISHNTSEGQITEEQVAAALPYNLGVISFGGPLSQLGGVEKVGEVAKDNNVLAWVETFIGDYSGRSNSIELTRSRMMLNNVSGVMYATALDLITANWPPPAFEKQSDWYSYQELISGYDAFVDSFKTWYLAEGYTGPGYETWVVVQNPTLNDAYLTATLMKTDGSSVVRNYTVLGTSRFNIDVNAVAPNVSVATKIESNFPVVAERAMYWNDRRGGHCSTAAKTTALTWYLAEGSTQEGFETWVVVLNPSDQEVDLDFTFMKIDGTNVVESADVGPRSRYTMNVNAVVPNEDSVSTKVEATGEVVVERAMYWTVDGVADDGGTCSNAVNSPATTWYLAEGSTQEGFETWVLVQNPNEYAVDVQFIFMKSDGNTETYDTIIAAKSRFTMDVRTQVPNEDSVATKVVATGGVIVERAMYWNNRRGGHACSGATETGTMFFLAEGTTGGPYSEWLVIQNPNATTAEVKVTFMRTDGTDERINVSVGPTSRATVSVDDVYALDDADVSTKVESLNGVGIIVERAMYWDTDSEIRADGHACAAVNAS